MDDRNPSVLSDRQVRRLRSHAQSLQPRSTGRVVDTVRAVAGVQAQLPQSAALCLRARTRGLDAKAVESARADERSVVRAWTMRGTLHLVPAEDLHWLLSLYNPVLRARANRRYRELKLTEDDLTAGVLVIRQTLARHGPMVRSALAEHLAAGGVDPSGQRLIHLINRAALEGVLCHGPDCDGDPSYVLCADWLGAGWAATPMSRPAAVAELAVRYVRAYGPATHRDFVTWSGLSGRETHAAWRRVTARMVQVVVAGVPAWRAPQGTSRTSGTDGIGAPAGAEGCPVVRLLPSFDTYLLGYRDRGMAVPAEHADAVWTGGWIKPTVLADGAVVGTWSTQRRRGQIKITVHPFGVLEDGLDRAVRDALAAEVADVGRFLGTVTSLTLRPPLP